MPRFSSWYEGINMYREKYWIQDSVLSDGSRPVKTSQDVNNKPEFVNHVKPPILTSRIRVVNNAKCQILKYLFSCKFAMFFYIILYI